MTKAATSTVDPTASSSKPETAPPKAAPKTAFIIDTTAIDAPRVHELIVDKTIRQFTFKPREPLKLPLPVAVKFLKHEGFQLANEKGEVIPYSRRPKQPNELGAGETFKLAENETIARYDELMTSALMQRALEMPGGEKFSTKDKPDRVAMIDFIKGTLAEQQKANTSKTKDIGEDDFVPAAEDFDGDDD